MNEDYMKSIHRLRVHVNALNNAIPVLELAGKTIPPNELEAAVQEIYREYGLTDFGA